MDMPGWSYVAQWKGTPVWRRFKAVKKDNV